MSDFEIADHPEEIAIIGMAGRFPQAKNVSEFWEKLCAGTELVTFFNDDELRAAVTPHAAEALAFTQSAHARYRRDASPGTGTAYRAYASAIAEHERQVGRRAHSFELNVQVLPLTQRGVWWIGSLTIAVTDGLRGDVAAFDAAIHPIIAELA